MEPRRTEISESFAASDLTLPRQTRYNLTFTHSAERLGTSWNKISTFRCRSSRRYDSECHLPWFRRSGCRVVVERCTGRAAVSRVELELVLPLELCLVPRWLF